MDSAGLYRSLLGRSWSSVDATVRAAHLSSDELRGAGRFRVGHGAGRFARVLARLLRMPRAASRERVELRVVRSGDGERWTRTFGDRKLVTLQRAIPGSLLSERFGCLEFRFRLTVRDGAIHYRQERVCLRFGPLRCAIPRLIAPTVAAVEAAGPGDSGSSVSVEVSMPAVGTLLTYGGHLQIEDGAR